MAKKKGTPLNSFLKEIRSIIREVDGGLVELTGKPLKEYLAGIAKDMGDDVYTKVTTGKADPYRVLAVTPTTPPEVIKQVYKGLVKLYHEAGASPNPERMRDINSAYDQICRERGWPK